MIERTDEVAVTVPAQTPPPGGDGSVPAAEPIHQRLLSALSPRRISAVYLLAFFAVLWGVITPETFLTNTTFRLVMGEGVVTCLIALAFLIPLVAGAYDLSVGAVMALALSISVYLNLHSGLSPVVGALVALAACALTGFVNGFIVVRLRVNSFIATLGTSQLLLAAVLLISNNQQIVAHFPNWWSEVGNEDILGGLPIVVLILLVVALLVWYVLEWTRTGRYLFSTGGNVEAARLSGVRTERLAWGAFVASAMIAGIAGIVYSMRTGLFSPGTGPGYLFPAVAAVFLGASQLSQRPNVWGTLIAYFALAFGVQGLVLSASSASVWSQPLFQGLSLIVAVAIASRPAVRKLRPARSDEVKEEG